MNRNLVSVIATGAVSAAALFAVSVIASTPAFADDITIEQQAFVSSRTRAEVTAELRTPYQGGNPWSGLYNIFQTRSTATSEQVQREYITDRDKVAAFQAEDSGSMYLQAQGPAPSPTRAMGAPAR